MELTLAEIIINNQFTTDKNDLHAYCDHFYEKEFAKYRDQSIDMIEIGVQRGGSIGLWAEYFNKVRLLGLDIDPLPEAYDIIAKYPNAKLEKLDAYRNEVVEAMPMADIIIDDGPHTFGSQIYAARNFVNRVKPGGMFIIEDVQRHEHFQELHNATPDHLKPHIRYIDLRTVKGRYDDMLFVVDIPKE